MNLLKVLPHFRDAGCWSQRGRAEQECLLQSSSFSDQWKEWPEEQQ